jgi:serine/threonine-protein kinase RsbW
VTSIAAPATVELELKSAPESVALVRASLKGFGSLLGLEPELVDDLQMVASEACTNVVRHAYGEQGGPLQVGVTATHSGLELVVSDRGEWVEEHERGDDEPAGLGLPVIRALADHTELTRRPEGGTEVHMRFEREIPPLLETDAAESSVASKSAAIALSGDVIATVSPISLLPGVLGRLARALAAQARFSVERLSDIHVLVESLTAHAQRWASNGRIRFALGCETRRLNFRLGPLRQSPSAVTGLTCTDSLRPRLSELVDEVEFEPPPEAEVLSLTFTERGLAHAV